MRARDQEAWASDFDIASGVLDKMVARVIPQRCSVRKRRSSGEIPHSSTNVLGPSARIMQSWRILLCRPSHSKSALIGRQPAVATQVYGLFFSPRILLQPQLGGIRNFRGFPKFLIRRLADGPEHVLSAPLQPVSGPDGSDPALQSVLWLLF